MFACQRFHCLRFSCSFVLATNFYLFWLLSFHISFMLSYCQLLCQDWVISLLFTIVPCTFLPVFYIILLDFRTVVIFFIFCSLTWFSFEAVAHFLLWLVFSFDVLLVFCSVVVKTFFEISRPRPRPLGSGLETKIFGLRYRDQDRDLGTEFSTRRQRSGQNENVLSNTMLYRVNKSLVKWAF